ncbi:D-alanyl-D-alanine carboxypeptidase family protein [Metabacillus niabensis]|uniref:D-alanyl-D-alanine carboxypeptidase n=1 Tax=Metabacillus niabensis TaxID=324854 RepID=A0ABT9YZM4_9BACI|nr:D-alanyl-D-alanine carboxypeptidase family protein [Metabacillus niabensis]MDQ0225445.1 D-alanyl-D-alanine carboxypeptidase [Metabacillus niabensis]
MLKKQVSSAIIIVLCLFLFPTIISANTNEQLELYSEAAILIDAQSGQVLYEKNSQEKLPPASITKIATAIYAIENGNLDDIVTVSENARNAEGTKVYLEAGEQVPLLKLVQGLLINSGNDAGVAIAEHLSGSVDEFVVDFNRYLEEVIGVENTHFTNPHGLYDPDHVTTAEDMAKITQYAMKNETFREIFSTKELPWDGETWDTTLINHHVMVRDGSYEGVTGGKNGFVTEAGFTLVTTANQENISLIAVTMKTMYDNQVYEDTTKLFNYGFQHYETDTIDMNSQFVDSEDNQYKTVENIYYTKKIGEIVEEDVTTSGKLVIKGEDGRKLVEKKLELVTNKEKEKQQIKNETIYQTDDNREQHLRIIIPISLIISFLIAAFFFKQTRKI